MPGQCHTGSGVKVLKSRDEESSFICQGVDGGNRQQKQPREGRKKVLGLLVNLL